MQNQQAALFDNRFVVWGKCNTFALEMNICN